MITPILSVAAFALLFALYGLTRPPKAGCGGNCGACKHGCALEKGRDGHV